MQHLQTTTVQDSNGCIITVQGLDSNGWTVTVQGLDNNSPRSRQ
jgi:hypothetical protein